MGKSHTQTHAYNHDLIDWIWFVRKIKSWKFIFPEDYISINAHLVSGLNCWDLIRTRAGGSSDPLSNSLKTSHKWGFRCHKFTHWISHKYRDLAETEAARSCLLLPTGWRAALNWRLCSTGEATHVRDARQPTMFNPKPSQKAIITSSKGFQRWTVQAKIWPQLRVKVWTAPGLGAGLA